MAATGRPLNHMLIAMFDKRPLDNPPGNRQKPARGSAGRDPECAVGAERGGIRLETRIRPPNGRSTDRQRPTQRHSACISTPSSPASS